jgi:hypothetical protein
MADPRIIIEALEDARGAYEAWGVGTTKLDRALAAARSLQAASQAQPEALTVPAEITVEMMEKAARTVGFDPIPGRLIRLAGVLNAMLAAAPTQAQQPAQQSDEQIDALLDDLDEIAREHDSYEFGLPVLRTGDEDAPIHKMRAKVRQWLAAAPQQTDATPLETVALAAGATVRDGESITFSVEAWQQFRAALVVAAPQQPAQQAVRMPLTRERMEAIFHQHMPRTRYTACFDGFGRAIEAAHGIALPPAAKEGEKKQ